MTPAHHPEATTLVAYASGELHHGASVIVATHLALCPRCRGVVEGCEVLGGALLEEADDEADLTALFDALLDRLDAPAPASPPPLPLPEGLDADRIPEPLRGLLRGRTFAPLVPGLVDEVVLHDDGDGAPLRLVRLAPSFPVPRHGHALEELTMPLEGGLSDHTGHIERGDVQTAAPGFGHDVVAAPEGCLALVWGPPVTPDGVLEEAPLLG